MKNTYPTPESPSCVPEAAMQLLELPEERFVVSYEAFVQERVAQLLPESTQASIGFDNSTRDFIGPEVPIVMGPMYRSYVLDDPAAYAAGRDSVRFFVNALKKKMHNEKAYMNGVVRGINFAQYMYFGSVTGNIVERTRIAADLIDIDETDQLSIKDFGPSAMCLERAAICHNMLKIHGVDSELVTGRLSFVSEDGSEQSEAHAYLEITNAEGARFIFDPTNPHIFLNDEGNIRNVQPALFKIDPSASVQMGEHKVYSRSQDGARLQKSVSLKYARSS